MLPSSSGRFSSYRERDQKGRRARSLIRFLILLVVVYLVIHSVFLQTVTAGSGSMAPAVQEGDRLMMSPLVYGPRIRIFNWIIPGVSEPRRGDMVSIRPAYAEDVPFVSRLFNPIVRFFTVEQVRLDGNKSWHSAVQVKRIIGLPGDTVRMERFVAYVQPEGAVGFESEYALSRRPYETITEGLPAGWRSDDPFGDSSEEIHLGPGEYFVLGDNRLQSIDSRHWGPVTENDIHGRIIFRYFPFARLGAPSRVR